MARRFDTLKDLLDAPFDTVIDVRSPAEFAEDHIPGAINLPALSNAERAQVGTIYKQDSPFKARKIGAALVARNVAAHLEGPLAGHDGSWRPLVHCWRGGQRSGSVAAILGQIGWRAETLAGGYQSYRRLVHAMLYDTPLPHRLVLLDGNTGTGKTALLPLLAARGMQVIDLEALARHRGSLLGAMPGGQPAQKGFESALAAKLARLDPARPVVAEAESSKIGRLILPPRLWAAMCAAPMIEVTACLADRARFLTDAYADLGADAASLRARLQPLRAVRGHAAVDRWEGLLAAEDGPALARALIEEHYDPAYARSRATQDRPCLGRVAATLDQAGLDQAAEAVAALVAAAHPA